MAIERHASIDRSQTQHEHLQRLMIHRNPILQICSYEKSLNKERIEVPSSSISIGSAILVLAREILLLANGINVLHTPVLFIIVTSFSLAVGHPDSINYQAT